MCEPAIHPLHVAASGDLLRLEKIGGGSKLQAHLSALGFVPGVELTLVNSSRRGPYIVALRSGKMILTHDMAQHLWVRIEK